MTSLDRRFSMVSALMILAAAAVPGGASAGEPSAPRRVVSFAHDWGGSSDVATLYRVPKGHRLVLTDISGYWWDEGGAQRFLVYQDVALKGSFLVTSRGRKGENGYTAFPSGFHSCQSGLVFEPGTDLRVIPSTTNISVTLAGYLEAL
ncbi:MAG: hypothetical protein FJ098_14415 [Deltaproteobacteria bacterium]|nr:hypothetical protein [Deltaproteobacteria bacterium]